ncbi:P-loop containing nucleoside triphosphate hydrolase protein, partial [Backusella circina FSU 941]
GRILSLESTASPLSSVIFSWMNSLLKQPRLHADTLWALPIQQRARENYKRFLESHGDILRRIFRANRSIILYQFITAVCAVLFHYANPYFLLKLLHFIQSNEDNRVMGWMYCGALFVCNVISTLVASQTLLWGRRWHVAMTHMLNAEIYAHALRLKRPVDSEEEEQASLMSQDTERLAELASYLHVTGVFFLYKILGTAFLAGLIVMVVALPSTHYISRRLLVAQGYLSDAKSWRIRLLRELCEGIKTIKFLASERRWEQAIANARDDELVKLIKLYTQNTILGLIWFATPVFVTTISFAWYTMVEKKTLDASLNHITAFLNTEIKIDDDEEDEPGETRIGFLETSLCKWPSVDFVLNAPPLNFNEATITLITGPTQSGKTSLLLALLGDMPLLTGKVHLPKINNLMRDSHGYFLHKVGYVSQVAWIENGTVRENILFSETWDDARYRAVLHQCDLLRDLSMLENGDLTQIGERGTMISESLKHKISLARAVYSRCKTLLIDDIFSVMGKVASTSIYENCIMGDLLKGRTLITVSAKPDLFWARDTSLLVMLDQGKVTMETEPTRMVEYIKQQRTHDKEEEMVNKKNDTIDLLFESMTAVPSEEDYFDEASLMRDSIRFDDEDDAISREEFKTRDYAYSTYFAACGGWRYWMTAILFTLLARLASISESYWLKEGKPYLYICI